MGRAFRMRVGDIFKLISYACSGLYTLGSSCCCSRHLRVSLTICWLVDVCCVYCVHSQDTPGNVLGYLFSRIGYEVGHIAVPYLGWLAPPPGHSAHHA